MVDGTSAAYVTESLVWKTLNKALSFQIDTLFQCEILCDTQCKTKDALMSSGLLKLELDKRPVGIQCSRHFVRNIFQFTKIKDPIVKMCKFFDSQLRHFFLNI